MADCNCDNISIAGVLVQSGAGDNSFASDLGVGIAAPIQRLHVKGPGGFGNNVAGQALAQLETDSTGNTAAALSLKTTSGDVFDIMLFGPGASPANAALLLNRNNASMRLMTAGADRIVMASNGDVGLGGSVDPSTLAGASLVAKGGFIGIGTADPTAALGIGGYVPRTIQVERHPGDTSPGSALTVRAGGAKAGSTDKAGGDLCLASGLATGQGTSNIYLQTAGGGESGTGDRAPETRVTILGNGKVGIGVSPEEMLHVAGSVKATGAVIAAQIRQAVERLDINPGTGDLITVLNAAAGRVGIGGHPGQEGALLKVFGQTRIALGSAQVALDVDGQIDATGNINTDGHLAAAGNVTAMSVFTADNLGVRVQSADEALVVNGDCIRLRNDDESRSLELRTDGGGGLDLKSAGDDLYINAGDGGWNTYINPDSGRVGIGMASPQEGKKLHVLGDVRIQGALQIDGDFSAVNTFKEYDSGWFQVVSNAVVTLSHNLGRLPKHVSVWCGQSSSPSTPSLANSLRVTTGSDDYGAYVAKCSTTSLVVRAGYYIGINENNDGVLTSGWYRVIAWA